MFSYQVTRARRASWKITWKTDSRVSLSSCFAGVAGVSQGRRRRLQEAAGGWGGPRTAVLSIPPVVAVLSEPDAKNDQEGSADGINQCQRGGNDAQVADGFVQEPLRLPFLVTEDKPGQYSGQ